MKRFMSIILSLIIIITCTGCGRATLVPSAQAYCVQYNEVSYTYDDIDTLIELIAEQISIMDAAHQMDEAGRQLGYSEDHHVIALASKEYKKAEDTMLAYQRVYDDLMSHWQQKEEEYPIATYIWSYLKDLGYSNQVTAGILGNIMAECGGNTLDIQYDLQTKSYYGICQWSKTYYSDVWGATLEEQCNYLKDTIKDEIDSFGYNYKSGFKYSDFLNISIVSEASLCFAKAYERCSIGSYRARQENAVIAYDYFIS